MLAEKAAKLSAKFNLNMNERIHQFSPPSLSLSISLVFYFIFHFIIRDREREGGENEETGKCDFQFFGKFI